MPLAARSLDRRQLLGSAAMLLVLSLPGSVARAVPSGAAAERVVQELVERVWQLFESGRLQDGAAYQQLLPIVEQQTDLTLLARLALGRHWRSASDAVRDEYLALFRRYVLRRFVERLNQYTAGELGEARERFAIQASQAVNERDTIVQSVLLPPSGPPVHIDWRLREAAEQPVIIDLIVEGVSLLVTQRSEFAAVVERAGMEGLLAELRARVGHPV